jgi:hypothetical protein
MEKISSLNHKKNLSNTLIQQSSTIEEDIFSTLIGKKKCSSEDKYPSNCILKA